MADKNLHQFPQIYREIQKLVVSLTIVKESHARKISNKIWIFARLIVSLQRETLKRIKL